MLHCWEVPGVSKSSILSPEAQHLWQVSSGFYKFHWSTWHIMRSLVLMTTPFGYAWVSGLLYRCIFQCAGGVTGISLLSSPTSQAGLVSIEPLHAHTAPSVGKAHLCQPMYGKQLSVACLLVGIRQFSCTSPWTDVFNCELTGLWPCRRPQAWFLDLVFKASGFWHVLKFLCQWKP